MGMEENDKPNPITVCAHYKVNMKLYHSTTATVTFLASIIYETNGLTRTGGRSEVSATVQGSSTDRRAFLGVSAASLLLGAPIVANAEAGADTMPDSLDVNDFLRSGMVSQPMGVSGQAGKSRPETGVVLRDGSDVLRDARSGSVAVEVLVGADREPVFVSFESPWTVAKGAVFDVECRDGKTGDGAFVAVTESTQGKALADLPNDFFLKRLFDPTGRYSFYGPPTDIKVKKSYVNPKDGSEYRFLELTFSNLSQSTNSEIPRVAIIAATIPSGTDNAVMLVSGSNASRWRKGSESDVRKCIESFRAIQAPKGGMKARAKKRGSSEV